MTDQTIPDGLTRDEAQAVREWAERSLTAQVQDETVAHAARVLLAVLPTPPTTAKETPDMPDQTLDDQVRPIVAAMRAAMRRDEHAYPEAKFLADLSGYIKDLEALLPAPPRPTLADMTMEERAACQWMQADVKGEEIAAGIIAKINPTDAHLIASDGETWFLAHDTVTPRPDLPRMEWPGDEKPASALPGGWRLADHKDHGRVIVTNTTPDRYGNVYYVLPADADTMGYDWLFCGPAELTYLDQEADQ